MAAAISQISASITLFSHSHIKFTPISSSLRGTPPPMSGRMMTGRGRRGGGRGRAGVVRCEQSSDQGSGSGVDVWLGRFAMVGFVAELGVEIGTGKGLLELWNSQNLSLTSPLPTAALALTAVVGVLTAIFIFRSASKN
ncbi:Stress enhanced protein 1, chloroplastic-like protein [Drosera capensis]